MFRFPVAVSPAIRLFVIPTTKSIKFSKISLSISPLKCSVNKRFLNCYYFLSGPSQLRNMRIIIAKLLFEHYIFVNATPLLRIRCSIMYRAHTAHRRPDRLLHTDTHTQAHTRTSKCISKYRTVDLTPFSERLNAEATNRQKKIMRLK